MEKTNLSDQVTPATTSRDAEKMEGFDVHQGVDNPSDDKASMSDRDSRDFQGGVQRVRAITSTWSTKTLVLMFIL
jgi:cobyric acid synthase